MNKVRYILLVGMLLCGAALSAQTYEDLGRSSLWSDSDNITGIRQDSLSASYAELFAGYEEGGFRDTWQAVRGWNAGARTASVRHMDRMSLAGSFSFRQDEGYGMCGSMFIKPGYYPVDILEFTLGRKTLQTYAFDGGISYDADPRWRIGAKMDFESANMAKRKDLRHSNWRLDMTVAPGFMFHEGDFAAGAAAVFGKTSESVDAEQVGTSESSYYAFLDKGLMYGTYGVWTGSGLHLDEAGVNGFPVREFMYGGSAQVQYRDFFADFRYVQTSGTVGEKEFIWFRFPGNEMSLNARYRIVGSHGGDHHFRLAVARRMQVMDETVLEKVSENGVTTVVGHGENRVQSRVMWTVAPQYEFVVNEFCEYSLGAEVGVQNGVASQMYPYVYSQSLVEASAYFGMEYSMGRFDWGVKGTFGKGWVSEEDRLVSEGSGVQTAPYRLQEWYDRQMEYRTAPRFRADVMARYNFDKGIYLRLDAASLHGYKLQYLIPSDEMDGRLMMTLSIGLDF